MDLGAVHSPFTFTLYERPARIFPFFEYWLPRMIVSPLILTLFTKLGPSLLSAPGRRTGSDQVLVVLSTSEYQMSSLSKAPEVLSGWAIRLKYRRCPPGTNTGLSSS